MVPALARTLGLCLELALGLDGKPRAEAPPPDPSPAPGPQSPRDRAGEAFALGEEAFADGNFHAAAAHFSRAQFLLPHPDTLYNLGVAWREAGQLMEAWTIFQRLRASAPTPEALGEVERELGTLRTLLAQIVVRPDGALVCLEGAPLEPEPDGTIRRLLLPGSYRLTVDASAVKLDLEPGESRLVDVNLVDALSPRPQPRKHILALSGTAAGGGLLAFGLGVGAAAAADTTPPRALGATAAVAGAAALAAGVTTLILELRRPWLGQPEPVHLRTCPSPTD